MVAITATNSATPSLQASLSNTRLQQARREAAQAESKAQDLRAQADTAESEAQRSQGRVRALTTSSADPTYQAKREPSPSGLQPENQVLLVELYQRSAALRGTGVNPLQTSTPPYPMQNTQGQTTGRIVNVRA